MCLVVANVVLVVVVVFVACSVSLITLIAEGASAQGRATKRCTRK